MKTSVMWYVRRDCLIVPVEIMKASATVIRGKTYWLSTNGKAYLTRTLHYNTASALSDARSFLLRATADRKIEVSRVAVMARNLAAMERAHA